MRRIVPLTIAVLALLVLVIWSYRSRETSEDPAVPIATALPSNPDKRVVVVISDALRADHLGCYGNTENLTPISTGSGQKALPPMP